MATKSQKITTTTTTQTASTQRKVPVQRTEHKVLDEEFSSIREKFELEMRKMEEEMNKFRVQLALAEQREREQKLQEQTTTIDPDNEIETENVPTSTSTTRVIEFDEPTNGLLSQQANKQQQKSSSSSSAHTTSSERRTTTTTTTRTTKQSGGTGGTTTAVDTSSEQQVHSSGTGDISGGGGTPTLARRSSSSAATATTTTTTATRAFLDGFQSPLITDIEGGHGARVLKLRFDVTQYEPNEIEVKTIDNKLHIHAKHEEKSENRSVYREYNREFQLPDGIDIEQIKSSLSKDGVLTVEAPLPTPAISGGSTRRIPIDKI